MSSAGIWPCSDRPRLQRRDAMISFVLALTLTALPHHAPVVSPSASPEAPAALSDAELADRVEAYLHVIDTPVTASQWKQLGPRATALLEARALDKEQLPTVRSRALEGLASVPGTGSERLMLEL